MTTMLSLGPGIARPGAWNVRRALALVERNMMMYRRSVVPPRCSRAPSLPFLGLG